MAVRPNNATEFELKNQSFQIGIKLGVYNIESLEVDLVDGQIA